MQSKQLTKILITLSLGLIYWTAGFSKLAPDHLANIIGPVDLGRIYDSAAIHIFMTFVAIYQIISGALVLSQRYAILGLILLFPLCLGILIFTIIAGFALTPIINLVLLALLVYALLQERKSLKQALKLKLSESIEISGFYQLYPNKKIAYLAIGCTLLTILLSFFFKSPLLNVLSTLSFLFFTINLFQAKTEYLIIDKILLVLFFIIGCMIINGIYLHQVVSKAFIGVLLLILFSFLLYFIRLVYFKFSYSKKNKEKEAGEPAWQQAV